jgi:PAS domain S-box-containing protein
MVTKKTAAAREAKKDSLRARAEGVAAKLPGSPQEMSTQDVEQIIHELQVHRIELEMQNDELRKAQVEIEESRARYVDLYDFSPVGYLTLNRASRILEANLTAARLLGTARRTLVGLIFTQFISPECRDLFIRFKSGVLEADGKRACELELCKSDGTRFWASLDGLAARDPEGGPPALKCAISDITARKLQDEKLRWEYSYRQAIDNSLLIGVAVWDLEGRQTYVNRAFCRMFGWSRDELVGAKPPFPYWPSEEAPTLFDVFSQVRRRKPTGSFEFRLLRKRGQKFDALVFISPLVDPDGKMTGWVGSFGDITERKRAEAEIRRLNRELEERVRQRTAELQEANRVLREEGRKLKTAHEELGQKTLELRKLTDTLEQRVAERTAELGQVNASLRAEITKHQSTESERRRLTAAADQASEGIVITDPEGNIRYANPAFERESGRSGENLIDRCYYDFLNEDEGDQTLKETLLDVVRLGLSWSFHLSRKVRDGQPREFDITFSPVKDRASALIGYLAIEREVTEQYELDQYFRRAQKLEALGTLAGGIAHDFNNILTPIVLNMELALLELAEGDPLRPYIETPLVAAQRGKELINQIITFSRQKEPRRERLKLAPLVKDSLKLLRVAFPKNIEVRQVIRRESGAVMADPGQIQQLVMNLCSNAVYAMKESGGTLEVNVAPVEIDRHQALIIADLRPGPYLKLTVKDTGAGMTPEVMDKAFDPFFTTKKPGEGSGMGLAVVQSIVRSLEGAVTAESELGRGSTFTVFLPRAKGAAPRRDRKASTMARGRESVLLVEDENVQVETLQRALGKLGYKVRGMNDGLKALALFRENPAAFDLVITDQTMPELTGLELAGEILKVRPDIPIILCTGFSEKVDAEAAAEAGITRFMMKPFTMREMAAAIRRALGKKT